MAHAAHAHDDHAQHPAEAAAAEPAPAGWPIALLLALATTAVTLYALLAPRPPLPVAAPAAPVAKAAAPASPLGPMVEQALPGGARVTVPASGVEGRLVAFIQDANLPADKSTWFDFDRLTFDTGSATLMESSQDQLRAVAAILAAFPAVKLKIGGYTDNVGEPAANQQLSEKRATEVRGALLHLGVAPERLAAEGYGEQFPVGDNATPEGRAMNRRISMRVMEK